MIGLYRHLVTDKVYQVISTEVIDATNSQNSKHMVSYINFFTGQMFVREYDEFFDGRFEKI